MGKKEDASASPAKETTPEKSKGEKSDDAAGGVLHGKKSEKKQKRIADMKMTDLKLAPTVVKKKEKVDEYDKKITSLIERMELVVQPKMQPVDDVDGHRPLNEPENQNPFEILCKALTEYAICQDKEGMGKLNAFAQQCSDAANYQRKFRTDMRPSMRHLRRFRSDYKTLTKEYEEMNKCLETLKRRRDDVQFCQNVMEIDKRGMDFKVAIVTFQEQTQKTLDMLNNMDTHEINHANDVVDYVGQMKKFYDQPKLSKP